jgi:hypothetical protein
MRRIKFGLSLVALFAALALCATPSFARTRRTARGTRYSRSTRSALNSRRALHPASFRGSASIRRTSVHRALWTPLFRPSHESMVIQNAEIDRLGLPRIQNQEQLDELVASGDLLPIVPSDTLRIDPRLDPERRYCRPWTLDFVNDLSAAFFGQFHDQIQINSAVRTADYQEKLRRHNANAAPESGDLASSHLAGITVDIQRMGMTMPEIKWVEQYMLPLHDAGFIEPEEERHQRCFHVMVSDRYEDWRDPQARATTGPVEIPHAADAPTTPAAP